MSNIMLAIFVVLFPILFLFIKERVRAKSKWSTLIVCYIVGLALGNVGILPSAAAGLLDTLSSVAVAI